MFQAFYMPAKIAIVDCFGEKAIQANSSTCNLLKLRKFTIQKENNSKKNGLLDATRAWLLRYNFKFELFHC